MFQSPLPPKWTTTMPIIHISTCTTTHERTHMFTHVHAHTCIHTSTPHKSTREFLMFHFFSSRTVPFTTVVDDNNDYYDWLMDFLHVDVFSANAGYRGYPAGNQFDFYNLWSGNPVQKFSGFYNLSWYALFFKLIFLSPLHVYSFGFRWARNIYALPDIPHIASL